jgi:hypothetical protein
MGWATFWVIFFDKLIWSPCSFAGLWKKNSAEIVIAETENVTI